MSAGKALRSNKSGALNQVHACTPYQCGGDHIGLSQNGGVIYGGSMDEPGWLGWCACVGRAHQF
jgi:hypothetical protein